MSHLFLLIIKINNRFALFFQCRFVKIRPVVHPVSLSFFFIFLFLFARLHFGTVTRQHSRHQQAQKKKNTRCQVSAECFGVFFSLQSVARFHPALHFFLSFIPGPRHMTWKINMELTIIEGIRQQKGPQLVRYGFVQQTA